MKIRNAYTLIEILVVLGIVSLLSAILFAAFSRVREKSRSSSCQNNLRQIQMATQMYADDNSRYPFWFGEYPITDPLVFNKPGIGWAVRILPYVKNRSIFHCPSEPTDASDDPNASLTIGQPAFNNYGYNIWLSDELESHLTTPSTTLTFSDEIPSPAWDFIHSINQAKDYSFQIRHSGGLNCAFADGHVKWLIPPQIFYSGRDSDVDGRCRGTYQATTCVY